MRINYDRKFSNGRSAFENIADLQNKILNAVDDDIDVYLIGSVRYGKAFIFLLGCLIVLGMQYSKRIRLYLPDKHVMEHFRAMGILDYYRQQKRNSKNFFRLDKTSNAMRLIEKNIYELPIHMTKKSQEILLSLIGEVYNNAIEHSEAKYVMGGCYKKQGKKKLYFSCYDTGIGIVGCVRKALGNIALSIEDYDFNKRIIKWALRRGTSTKPPPRGLGLDWLLDFARLNHGRITICCSNVVFVQNPSGEHNFSRLQNKFQGTFFEMEIIEDKNVLYRLRGEEI